MKKFPLLNTKKAESTWLAEHVLDMILAVICVLIIIFMAVYLYKTLTGGDTNVLKAKSAMRELENKVRGVLDSQTNSRVVIEGVEGRAIVGWPGDDGKTVDFCSSKNWNNCLCVCNLGYTGINKANWKKLTREGVLAACNKEPLCFEVPVARLEVNPTSLFFGWLQSSKTPILIDSLWESYVGEINLNYDRSLDKLSLIPRES